MRAVIVDDERLARVDLRRMIDAAGEVDVVGEARGCAEAIALIDAVRPDLVFLDVQMPDGDGFSVLERLAAAPHVIFTTAYDHYAVRAFTVSALDYLQKPIVADRLAAALAKVRAALARAAPAAPTPDDDAARGPGADRLLGRGDRIFVRDGERCWFVPVERIALIEADGNYAQLTFGGERALIARSLGAIADRLDPALFFRANRQQIINLDFVESLAPWPNDGYLVRLAGGREVEMSRRQARLFHAARRL